MILMKIFSINSFISMKLNKSQWYWFLLLLGLSVVHGEFIFWFLGSIIKYHRYEILMVLIAVIFLIFRKLKYSIIKKSNAGSVQGYYLLIFSLILLLLGKYSNIEGLQVISLTLVIISLFLVMVGIEMAKILILPVTYFLISYAIFEFHMEGESIAIINYNLQIFTASISNFILKLMGIPVVQDWEYLDLPHVTLYVGPSCSGLNHLIAIFLLAIPLALTGNKRMKHQLILIIIALFIGLIMNGMRVSAIALWSFLYGEMSFHGPNDIFLIVSVFILGSIFLMVISFEFDQKVNVQRPVALKEAQKRTFNQPQSGVIQIVSLGAIALVMIFPIFVNVNEICLKHELTIVPETLKRWHTIDILNTNEILYLNKCDRFLKQVYFNDTGDTVSIQIIYLAKQDENKKLTNYMSFSSTMMSETVHLLDTGIPNLIINRSYSLRDSSQPSIYSWYQLRERILTNWISVKFYSLWQALRYQTTNGALVKIYIKSQLKSDIAQRKDEEYKLLVRLVPYITSALQHSLIPN